MKGKLRKFAQIALLAVVLGAALLPSVVLAQGTSSPPPAASSATPAATTPAATTPPPATVPSNQTADAGFLANIVVRGIASLVGTLIELFGKLTIQLIDILVQVAQYNGYMDSPAITTGWTIVRDVANLFFVALILVVSIGSIVNPDKFGGAKQVFRILLFALFVNFSRFIAALCIDVSQLVMLTFVNGFAQAAGGNFTEALGVTKLTELAAGGALTPTAAVAGIFMALFMFVVITVIIGVMVVALIVRMVTLWLLVVISPLAFACGASSITKAHYDDWWKKFSAELTTGPIVAFFLWLSLVSLQGTTGSGVTGQVLQGTTGAKTATNISCGETAACSEENMIRFIVAAVMLLAGLGFAKEFSGLGGTLAKGAASYGSKYANNAARWTARKAALPVAGALVAGPAGVAAVGGITLASRSQRVRNFAGKTMARVPDFVPGMRSAGLRLQANVAKERLENVKKAEETAKFGTWEQMKNRTYTVTKDSSGKVTGASERLTVPMETALANYKLLMKNKEWLANASAAEKQFVMAKATEYGKVMKDKETGDLVTDVEKANPNLIPADKKATDPVYNDPAKYPKLDFTKHFAEIMENLTTGDALKMDKDAFTPQVVAHMPLAAIKKVLDDGNAAQFDALAATLKKFADPKDTSVGKDDRDAYYEKIEDNKRSVDTLSKPELEIPEMIVKVMEKPPNKDREDLFKNKEKKRVIGDTASKELNDVRSAASFNKYQDKDLRLAEATAVSRESIDDAYRYNKTTHAFPDSLDQGAFEKGLRGKSQAEVSFAVDVNEINANTDAGQSMARTLTAADITNLAKKAEGNTRREDSVKAIIKTINDIIANPSTRPDLKVDLEDKIKKLEKSPATNKFT